MRSLEIIAIEVDQWISLGYSPNINSAETRQAEIDRIQKQEARFYLNSTDWYIIRKMERDIDVPQAVTDNRLIAISVLNET